jgi:hypothetical protein
MGTNQFSTILFFSLIALTSVSFAKNKSKAPDAVTCSPECNPDAKSKDVLRLESLITQDGLAGNSALAPADNNSDKVAESAAKPITPTVEDAAYAETDQAMDFDSIMSDIKVRDVTVQEALKKKNSRRATGKDFFNSL